MLEGFDGGPHQGRWASTYSRISSRCRRGYPFYSLENVLLSPHCADHTADWLDQAMRFFLENFERFRKGEPLRNVVNKRLGY